MNLEELLKLKSEEKKYYTELMNSKNDSKSSYYRDKLLTIYDNLKIKLQNEAEIIKYGKRYQKVLAIRNSEDLNINSKTKKVITKEKIKEEVEARNAISNNKVTFNDVVGMEDVKEDIKRHIIYPIKNPEYYEGIVKNHKKGTALVLEGKPGNGKTYFAKAIQGELNADFYRAVKISEVLSSKPGESEKYIKNLFEDAREHELSVIFFDEFDAIATKRGNSDNATTIDNKLVNAILQEVDMFDKRNTKNVMVLIAATNRIESLDPAIIRPGRFGKVYRITEPNADARKAKFKMELNKINSEKIDYENINLELLSKETEGFSFADIQHLISEAVNISPEEEILKGDKSSPENVCLKMAHLTLEIERLKAFKN